MITSSRNKAKKGVFLFDATVISYSEHVTLEKEGYNDISDNR